MNLKENMILPALASNPVIRHLTIILVTWTEFNSAQCAVNLFIFVGLVNIESLPLKTLLPVLSF